jgi:predicted transposase YdaD
MTTYQNVFNDWKIEGIKKGIEEGTEKGIEILVINVFKKGFSVPQIVEIMDLPVEQVRSIIEKHLTSQGHKS